KLRELGLTVGAGVLVAKTADDLHVLVAAGDHQELLEKLGRLWKRIETSGHQPRGDDEIPCAFGRGFGEEWSLDFPETQIAEHIPHHLGHAVARAERLLHLDTAQVDVTMCKPFLLVNRFVLAWCKR